MFQEHEEFFEIPMVQQFICVNMPIGGYGVVAGQLSNKRKVNVDKVKIVGEVRQIRSKSQYDIEILQACVEFLINTVGVEPDKYTKQFLGVLSSQTAE